MGCSGSTQLYGFIANYSGSRVISMCDTTVNQCQSHGYDEFNRLTSVSGSGGPGSFTYSYDRYGNRTSQTGSPSVSYSFDAGSNHNNSFSYDAAGNQTSDGIHSYTYDAEGRVANVDGGSTATYTYDAMNNRVRVDVAGGDSYEYLFDPSNRRISSWRLDGSASGFGNEGRIYWDYGLLANRAWNGTTYFHHQDWQGTERLRTDYAGNIANGQRSLAFGDGFSQDSTDPYGGAQDNNQFTSQDRDAETNTTHFQYRQYNPTQGRWMSPDPYAGSYDLSNPQSLNRYAYVLNNSYSLTDPSGLCDQYCTPSQGGTSVCINGEVLPGNDSSACYVSGGGGGLGFGPGGSLGGTFGAEGVAGSTGGGGSSGPAPNKTTCKTGFGAGITIGADAGVGIGPLGAGGNGSVGAGVFGGNGINAGAFASGGAAARSFGNLASAAGSMIHNFFAGVGGGVGGGLFLTNASQASQLSGQSQTYNVDLGYFANGSGQFSVGTDAAGNEIWSFSFQVGVGGGGLFHAVTNKTVTAGRKGGC